MSRTLLALSLILLASGCGGESGDQWSQNRPKTSPASGVVTYKGQPVDGANVNFAPPSGDGTGASAMTDAEGKFKLGTFDQADGAVPGAYKVIITKKKVETTPNPKDPNGPPVKTVETSLIPVKYSKLSSTVLDATVSEAGPNEFVFELKD
ncbi:carboxypeptidase-like regulatory domain-containing protein [Planctomicrobium sp. SH527]|uniref:carboxypeptidase-like regulatory domain-containing protein n=1 Tax=Planctomicrobium sp. SH527 TaxID=3448123 RepID=UPI003F5B1490